MISTEFDVGLNDWLSYIESHEECFRAALRAARDREPVLLLMDARGPGRGWDAAIRLLRRRSDAADATEAELIARVFPPKGRGIVAQATDLKTASFAIGHDLCLSAVQRTEDSPCLGRRGWFACVGEETAYVGAVWFERSGPLLEGALFATKGANETGP